MTSAKFCFLAFFLLSSCAIKAPSDLAPINRPAQIIPPSFTNLPIENGQNIDFSWDKVFSDKNLNKAISIALRNNRNLRVSAANIEKSAAQLALINASRLPIISLGANTSFNQSAGSVQNNSSTQNYGTNVGFSNFEIDIYSKLRANTIAAQENLMAQKENQAALKLSIISQTALGWFAIVSDRHALLSAQNTRASWQQTLNLVSARLARGLSSDLDETSIRIQLNQIEADILTIQTRLNQNKALFFAIVGEQLDDENFNSNLVGTSSLDNLPKNLNSAILLNRPDIMAAEHNLLANYANIKAARANFFPRITITSALGLATRDFGNLFNSGAFAYNLAGNITAPIFDNGQNQANYDIAISNQKIALNQYENAIIAAFSESWAALSVRAQFEDRIETQMAIVSDAKKAKSLVEARFKLGLDSYLPLLAAERTLYSAEQNLINLEYQKAVNVVSIYRAIGADNSIIDRDPN